MEAEKRHAEKRLFDHVLAGIDGRPEGWDAAYLAVILAEVTGASVTLVTVVEPSPVPVPSATDRNVTDEERAEEMLRELRDLLAPGARILVESGRSVPPTLECVVKREQQDLLVVGSNRHGRDGQVRIGRRTRRLLRDAQCPVAVAPHGLCADGQRQLVAIGVGYDGKPEAVDAVRAAGALARAAGARLIIRAVLDDRLPYAGPRWLMPVGRPELQGIWDQTLAPDVEALRVDAERAASATGADVRVDAKPGSPPEELIALSEEVDLLVIGSRRWRAATRVRHEHTGEQLLHEARCAVVVVPPAPSTSRRGALHHHRPSDAEVSGVLPVEGK